MMAALPPHFLVMALLLISAGVLVELKPMSKPVDLSVDPAKSCQEGFVLLNGQCYYFSDTSKSWYGALSYCMDQNAHLASLITPDDNKAVKNYLLQNFPNVTGVDGWWIGGTDATIEGDWVWTSNLWKILHQDWCAGEPNNDHGEHCLSFDPSCAFQWNDRTCSYNKFRFVCKAYLFPRWFEIM